MSLPDFLCIGAQKAGTSWLNKVLLEHPQVFMPPINELHFFDRFGKKLRPRKRQVSLAEKAIKKEEAKGDTADQAFIRYLRHFLSFEHPTLEWYKAVYDWPVAAGVKKGDITPSYLEMSEELIAFARELLGPVKLILIIRRPSDRLLSQLRMWAARDDRTDIPQNEKEWMDLLLEMTGKNTRGGYGRGINLWRTHFGEENLLVLPYGDMRADPHGMIRRIEDHIGIAHYDSYTLLTEQIHVTKKLEIPPSVVAAATAMTVAEDDYIRHEFGEEFFQRTK